MKKRLNILETIILIVSCLFSLIPFFIIFICSFNDSVSIRKGDIITGISLRNLIDNFITLFSKEEQMLQLYTFGNTNCLKLKKSQKALKN